MTADLEIRDREPGDLPACVQILAQVHLADDYPSNWPSDPGGWLSPPNLLHAWVAELDGALTGHVLLQPAGGSDAAVGRLFVAPRARGHGVGAALLSQVRQFAYAQRLGLVLEVASGKRDDAIQLYERTGWRRIATELASWTTPGGDPVTLHRYTI